MPSLVSSMGIWVSRVGGMVLASIRHCSVGLDSLLFHLFIGKYAFGRVFIISTVFPFNFIYFRWSFSIIWLTLIILGNEYHWFLLLY